MEKTRRYRSFGFESDAKHEQTSPKHTRRFLLMRWQPDPTFYPSPKMAMEAPAEKLAYVALLNPTLKNGTDAMGVVDVDVGSKAYGKMVGRVDMPHAGDELHHFGWN